MTNSTPDLPVLDDDAVIEIEARLKEWDGGAQHPASWNNVRALCQTVRALRAENKRVTETREHYEQSYILPCFIWAEKAGFDLREAVRVNEGHNCVELLVSHLQSQLEQVTKERDNMRQRILELETEIDTKRGYL